MTDREALELLRNLRSYYEAHGNDADAPNVLTVADLAEDLAQSLVGTHFGNEADVHAQTIQVYSNR